MPTPSSVSARRASRSINAHGRCGSYPHYPRIPWERSCEKNCERWCDGRTRGARRRPGDISTLLIDLVGDVVDRLAGLALGLAKPLAHLAGSALAAALRLELRVIESFAGLFFDVALRLLGLALDLVTIHARLLRIARCCERNPTRSQGFFLQGRCQRPLSCRSATHVSVGFFEFGHFARQ